MGASEQADRPNGIAFHGGYQVYSDSGVDLTLLRANLRRSLQERWERGRRALVASEAFRKALKKDQGLSPSSGMDRKDSHMIDAIAFVKLLAAHNVQFIVVGGQAMRAHGSAHITEDIDICYQRTPANLAALVAAFASIHPYLRGAPPGLPFRFDVPTLAAGLNFTLDTDLGEIDLLGEIAGIGDYEKVLAQSEVGTLEGLNIYILSLEGLIAAKRAAGRAKDQAHLLELVELKKMRDANESSEPKA